MPLAPISVNQQRLGKAAAVFEGQRARVDLAVAPSWCRDRHAA